MKISEAERTIKEQIGSNYTPGESSKIASMCLEHISGISYSNKLLNKDKELTESQLNLMYSIIERLKNHEPIQYILNLSWFYGMELYVNKDVLIPRPETEELVQWIIQEVQQIDKNLFFKTTTEADKTTKLKILDVGTGSGCIALALKKEIPLAEVWGCDISDKALNVARRNGSELDIRVDFQSVDFLNKDQQKHLPSVDIIVSNPPYVPHSDKNEMQPNVLQYEPHTALFVDDKDPLLFYRSIIAFASHRLHKNGRMYMEIHESFAEEVKFLFTNEGYNVEVRKDMQGKERMIRAMAG